MLTGVLGECRSHTALTELNVSYEWHCGAVSTGVRPMCANPLASWVSPGSVTATREVTVYFGFKGSPGGVLTVSTPSPLGIWVVTWAATTCPAALQVGCHRVKSSMGPDPVPRSDRNRAGLLSIQTRSCPLASP